MEDTIKNESRSSKEISKNLKESRKKKREFLKSLAHRPLGFVRKSLDKPRKQRDAHTVL